jgi:ATP-dependent Lon protease
MNRDRVPRCQADHERKRHAGQKVSSSHSPEEAGTYPVLPLRDIVVFPHMIVPLFVGRENRSVRSRK